MKDNQGREYLKLTEATEGQIVELDDGFTCHKAGKVKLRYWNNELVFECKDGVHTIAGQADDGVYCIGIYPVVQP